LTAKGKVAASESTMIQTDPYEAILDSLAELRDEVVGLRRQLGRALEELGILQRRFYTVHEVATLVRRSPYTVRRWLREGRLKGIRMKGEVPGDDHAFRAPSLIPWEEVAKLHAKGWIRSASEEPPEASVVVTEEGKKGPVRDNLAET
jgi:excisionase family DNA binding protein